MSSAITTLGEQLIAQKIGNQQALTVDKFILANIPGLDPAAAVNRAEQKPAAGDIVHTYVIPAGFVGYVNTNQVVYSMLLGSNIGPFSFNWIGLYSSADNVVVAISYVPATAKWQSDVGTNTLGNNLTRNFLLEFTGAQACTGVTVTAETWQVDFTVRLAGIDDRARIGNLDVYGRSCFWGNGWEVANTAGAFSMGAGIGYVAGIRCALGAAKVITPGALPKNVYLDVSLQPSSADVSAMVVEAFSAGMMVDYTDGNGIRHYLEKIAEIDAGGTVIDTRRTEDIPLNVILWISNHLADTVPHEATPLAEAERLIIRNEDGQAEVGPPVKENEIARLIDVLSATNHMQWRAAAVGESKAIESNDSALFPPINSALFRYIKLSTGEYGAGQYNEGILINETISGSGADLQATAVVNLPESPLHGQTIHLRNTEGSFLRPGVTAGVFQGDAIRDISGSIVGAFQSSCSGTTGAFTKSSVGVKAVYNISTSVDACSYLFSASTVVPTAAENRPKNVSAIQFLRVK